MYNSLTLSLTVPVTVSELLVCECTELGVLASLTEERFAPRGNVREPSC